MLEAAGYLDIDEITSTPGFPGDQTLNNKKCAVIECVQNIPCNPCEIACPHGAITVGQPITNLPVIDESKCIGCGLCIAKCPGQAIFVVDQTNEKYDVVSLPYEYIPMLKAGDDVVCFDRSGQSCCMGAVRKYILSKGNDRTAVVEVEVPKGFGMKMRGVRYSDDEKTLVKEIEKADDNFIVCRCEEITKGEVLAAIRSGAVSANEVKRVTRAGMGLCSGRNCGRTIERLIAQELNIPVSDVIVTTKRAPVRPLNYSACLLCADAQETKDIE